MTDVGAAYIIVKWAPADPRKALISVARRSVLLWGAQLFVVRLGGSITELFGFKGARGAADCDRIHWAFRFATARPDDRIATRIGDSLEGLFSLVYGPVGAHPITVHRVPCRLIRRGNLIRFADLKKDDNSRVPAEAMGELGLHMAFGHRAHIPAEIEREIWRLLPACKDDRIFRAVAFLRGSYENVWFSPGDIWDMMSFEGKDTAPASAVDAARFESAFLNAYKAIEAVIGDPPKDDNKLKRKLIDAGLDPNEEIGFDNKMNLLAKIRSLTAARDKRAAHGSTPRAKAISQGELVDWQGCARYVIYRAAENLIKKPREAGVRERHPPSAGGH